MSVRRTYKGDDDDVSSEQDSRYGDYEADSGDDSVLVASKSALDIGSGNPRGRSTKSNKRSGKPHIKDKERSSTLADFKTRRSGAFSKRDRRERDPEDVSSSSHRHTASWDKGAADGNVDSHAEEHESHSKSYSRKSRPSVSGRRDSARAKPKRARSLSEEFAPQAQTRNPRSQSNAQGPTAKRLRTSGTNARKANEDSTATNALSRFFSRSSTERKHNSGSGERRTKDIEEDEVSARGDDDDDSDVVEVAPSADVMPIIDSPTMSRKPMSIGSRDSRQTAVQASFPARKSFSSGNRSARAIPPVELISSSSKMFSAPRKSSQFDAPTVVSTAKKSIAKDPKRDVPMMKRFSDLFRRADSDEDDSDSGKTRRTTKVVKASSQVVSKASESQSSQVESSDAEVETLVGLRRPNQSLNRDSLNRPENHRETEPPVINAAHHNKFPLLPNEDQVLFSKTSLDSRFTRDSYPRFYDPNSSILPQVLSASDIDSDDDGTTRRRKSGTQATKPNRKQTVRTSQTRDSVDVALVRHDAAQATSKMSSKGDKSLPEPKNGVRNERKTKTQSKAKTKRSDSELEYEEIKAKRPSKAKSRETAEDLVSRISRKERELEKAREKERQLLREIEQERKLEEQLRQDKKDKKERHRHKRSEDNADRRQLVEAKQAKSKDAAQLSPPLESASRRHVSGQSTKQAAGLGKEEKRKRKRDVTPSKSTSGSGSESSDEVEVVVSVAAKPTTSLSMADQSSRLRRTESGRRDGRSSKWRNENPERHANTEDRRGTSATAESQRGRTSRRTSQAVHGVIDAGRTIVSKFKAEKGPIVGHRHSALVSEDSNPEVRDARIGDSSDESVVEVSSVSKLRESETQRSQHKKRRRSAARERPSTTFPDPKDDGAGDRSISKHLDRVQSTGSKVAHPSSVERHPKSDKEHSSSLSGEDGGRDLQDSNMYLGTTADCEQATSTVNNDEVIISDVESVSVPSTHHVPRQIFSPKEVSDVDRSLEEANQRTGKGAHEEPGLVSLAGSSVSDYLIDESLPDEGSPYLTHSGAANLDSVGSQARGSGEPPANEATMETGSSERETLDTEHSHPSLRNIFTTFHIEEIQEVDILLLSIHSQLPSEALAATMFGEVSSPEGEALVDANLEATLEVQFDERHDDQPQASLPSPSANDVSVLDEIEAALLASEHLLEQSTIPEPLVFRGTQEVDADLPASVSEGIESPVLAPNGSPKGSPEAVAREGAQLAAIPESVRGGPDQRLASSVGTPNNPTDLSASLLREIADALGENDDILVNPQEESDEDARIRQLAETDMLGLLEGRTNTKGSKERHQRKAAITHGEADDDIPVPSTSLNHYKETSKLETSETLAQVNSPQRRRGRPRGSLRQLSHSATDSEGSYRPKHSEEMVQRTVASSVNPERPRRSLSSARKRSDRPLRFGEEDTGQQRTRTQASAERVEKSVSPDKANGPTRPFKSSSALKSRNEAPKRRVTLADIATSSEEEDNVTVAKSSTLNDPPRSRKSRHSQSSLQDLRRPEPRSAEVRSDGVEGASVFLAGGDRDAISCPEVSDDEGGPPAVIPQSVQPSKGREHKDGSKGGTSSLMHALPTGGIVVQRTFGGVSNKRHPPSLKWNGSSAGSRAATENRKSPTSRSSARLEQIRGTISPSGQKIPSEKDTPVEKLYADTSREEDASREEDVSMAEPAVNVSADLSITMMHDHATGVATKLPGSGLFEGPHLGRAVDSEMTEIEDHSSIQGPAASVSKESDGALMPQTNWPSADDRPPAGNIHFEENLTSTEGSSERDGFAAAVMTVDTDKGIKIDLATKDIASPPSVLVEPELSGPLEKQDDTLLSKTRVGVTANTGGVSETGSLINADVTSSEGPSEVLFMAADGHVLSVNPEASGLQDESNSQEEEEDFVNSEFTDGDDFDDTTPFDYSKLVRWADALHSADWGQGTLDTLAFLLEKLFTGPDALEGNGLHRPLLVWKMGGGPSSRKTSFISYISHNKIDGKEKLLLHLQEVEKHTFGISSHTRFAPDPDDPSKVIAVKSLRVPPLYDDFYEFTFDFVKGQESQNLSVESALVAWNLIMTPYFAIGKEFVDYVFSEALAVDTISRELWSVTLDFCKTVQMTVVGERTIYTGYEERPWPQLVKDYVEWTKSNKKVDTPGQT